MYELGIIGAGAMGSHLALGFVQRGALAAEQIIVSDVRAEPLARLREQGLFTTEDNQELVSASKAVLLAVKPQNLAEVVSALRFLPEQLVISIAAGITLGRLEELLGARPLIRVMPNILVTVGEAASAYAANAWARPEHLGFVHRLFTAVGTAVSVEEKVMDAVTGLSGSGPAFVAALAEAMIDGGVAAGLPRPQAIALAAQTLKGVGEWLLSQGESPAQLKDLVTSPGGTTMAGLRMLERGGLRSAIIEAIIAATERAAELGKKLDK